MIALLLALAAQTGTYDPAEPFRERPVNTDGDIDGVLHGHARARTAVIHGADLGLVSPTTQLPPFVAGTVFGHDLRARLTPSMFIGERFRFFLDADAAQLALGPAVYGAPHPVDPGLQLSFFDLRAVGVDFLMPIGVLSIGRMPSQFGLGIGTHAGTDLDDDGGDRADRIQLVVPFFGHLIAAAFDTNAIESRFRSNVLGPTTRALAIGDQAVSFGVARWHAPWEVDLYRKAARPLFDYGGGLSIEWSGPAWDASDPETARLAVLDAWARFVWGAFSLEGEAWAGDFLVANPSPWRNVRFREPLVGNPYAAAVVAEMRWLPDVFSSSLETGVASTDPAPGFPASRATPYTRGVPGDVEGPQIDAHARDLRFDAARIHPLHRVDLLLWRTILCGVSEAAYLRAGVEGHPHELVTLDAHAIYSHALDGEQTPGGRAPLGAELDVGAEVRSPWQIWDGALSLRVDAGVLQPLGGMATRGTTGAAPAGIAIARVGYEL